ncbi:thiol:disulfide interchange protein DsbA/DsbL [Agrilutibacter solisilvae]|uniref:Thiol:disulfide interchange protein DsbA n=1 Tax=Agrilutibacter solisilvae TaxID=2763317 RepID=A0A974Y056_9GAMM|nr:thiol:disulfide interchange protein DsbA/DsbL [Lysobacter solisilvae]QSX78981.1 thiol:disulfide interchange protein DsbA/DsbL [Lysobacter solisilvae]
MTARIALLLALLLSTALSTALAPVTAYAAPAAPAAPALVEGQDYTVIADGQPYAPLAGKIEVAEIFLYTCHHCANFDPMVQAWKARLPKDVRFSYVPLVYEADDALGQAYFAAESMGALGTTHARTFQAIHEAHTLPRNATLGEVASYYAELGLDAGRFTAAAASPAVAAKMARAREFALGSGLEGTPALVVNGRYLVTGRTFEDQLRIAGQLVARERAAAKRRR